MINPPRTAEVVLESLCAQATFGDALLGDLAEGFALRVARDGERVARRWYYREAMRSTVFLLFDWIRRLRVADARRLGGVLLASYVFTMMLARFAITVAASIADAIGLSSITTLGGGPPALVPLWLWIPFGVAYSTLAGYIAGWLNEKEPLPTVIALSIVWTCTLIALRVLTGGDNAPGWLVGIALLVTAVSPVAGGILRIRHQALRAATA